MHDIEAQMDELPDNNKLALSVLLFVLLIMTTLILVAILVALGQLE